MASGKTTVGRIVAARTGWRFHDLDQIIADAAGRSVARIFADEGEAGFRKREDVALRMAARLERAVIATGGGAACNEENLQLMRASGQVIALEVTAEEVVRRAGSGSDRPLLRAGLGAGVGAPGPISQSQPGPGAGRPASPLEVAASLLDRRASFYRRAHHRIDTMSKSPEEVAAQVLGLIDADPA